MSVGEYPTEADLRERITSQAKKIDWLEAALGMTLKILRTYFPSTWDWEHIYQSLDSTSLKEVGITKYELATWHAEYRNRAVVKKKEEEEKKLVLYNKARAKLTDEEYDLLLEGRGK